MSVRPCCFSNPRLLLPPCQAISPRTNYQMTPPSSPNISPPLSPITTSRILPSKLLLTLKSSPRPLTSPPLAPTQPFTHSSPLTISLDPIELMFSTPPTSPQALFDSLEDLPPRTTTPPSPRPSFDSMDRLANQPPPLPAMELPLLPFPQQLPSLPPPPPTVPPHLSNFPPLQSLGPNNPFLMLTYEMFYDHCQRTQVIVDNLYDEMRFILNHILDRLNALVHNY
ncbi:hypothetical protein Tco_1422216 [Tanacetum coccineum]